MPYYERTGMQSHRHPFYGYGQATMDWSSVADEATAAAMMAVQAASPEAAQQQADATLAQATAQQQAAKPASSSGTLILIGAIGVVGLGLLLSKSPTKTNPRRRRR